MLFLGMVQVSETSLPLRTAERSATRSGRSSEGGWGAPGVPHPVIHADMTIPKTAQPARLNVLIALSV